MENTNRRSSTKGVTILEILIVLTIMALVAALAGPRLIGYLGRAKSETANLQIQQVQNALQLFYIDLGRYPSDAEGLRLLIESPSGEADWRGPYLDADSAIIDPWDRPYLYESSNETTVPQVSSYGRDGREGGTGEDADIAS